jgi:endogenous inhibitor of DNA gyrase (YacG/DUF329 family)
MRFQIKDSCPDCGYQFRWIETARSMNFGFARRVVACPKCNTRLIWAKGPWRVMNGGMVMFFGLSVVLIMTVDDLAKPWAYCLIPLSWLAGYVGLRAGFSMRLESIARKTEAGPG